MKILGLQYETPDDITVEIEGKRAITLPVDAYKTLFEQKDNLRAFIESLPVVEVGEDVDDMEEGSEANFLRVDHVDFGEIFVFFQFQGNDDVVVTAGCESTPEAMFSRTLTLGELLETVEYVADQLND